MDAKIFQELVRNHRNKLNDAWIQLSDFDWKFIGNDLQKFLKRTSEVYKVPEQLILKELEIVHKNIEEGIQDYVPYLDPME